MHLKHLTVRFLSPWSCSADCCLPCTAELGCCPACCSTQRWGSPLFPLEPAPSLASPQWVPKQQPVTPAVSGREGAGTASIEQAWLLWELLGSSLPADYNKAGRVYSPPSHSSSFPSPLNWFTYLYLPVLVFLLSLPFTSITLQALIWDSSVSSTSLLPASSTLFPMPPAFCPPQLPFCSSCSHCTQQ